MIGIRAERKWNRNTTITMLTIAVELAASVPAWDEIATKFLEHFLLIAHAMRSFGTAGESLWDDEDGFFYDRLRLPDGSSVPVKVRSMVGIMPLVGVIDRVDVNGSD